MWRRIWVKALQMFCHDHFPRMLATKLSSASFVRRQRDGLAVGVAGLAADCGRSTGGRVRDLPGILLGNQEGDQLGVDPSLCKFRFLGCQLLRLMTRRKRNGVAATPSSRLTATSPSCAVCADSAAKRSNGVPSGFDKRSAFQPMRTMK